MKQLLFSLLSLFGGSILWAQNASISGQILDSDNKGLPFATVLLMQSSDSVLVKGNNADEAGNYLLDEISAGDYFLLLQSAGMQNAYSAPFHLENGEKKAMPAFTLKMPEATTDAVVIAATKPMIEVKPDMTVFNVESSVTSVGQNALEVLRKAPGVFVDKDNNVLLRGRANVMIYINGKPSNLQASDLTGFLQSLPSSDIEAIEVITQPSAKYDAAGNAGIINIRLKKNKKVGMNGNVSLGISQGITPKYNNSLGLNYRNEKINVFGNYSNNIGRNESYMYLDRIQKDTTYNQFSTQWSDDNAHNVRTGIDVFLNDKHSVGAILSGNYNDRNSISDAETPIQALNATSPSRYLLAQNYNPSTRRQLNANVNYRYADTVGTTLGVDLDWGTFHNDGSSYQPNRYESPEGILLAEKNYRNLSDTKIQIYTAKTDYERKVGKGKLGLGAKYAQVGTGNDFQFFNVLGGNNVLDTSRSNNFNYTEKVSAVYTQYQYPYKKWNFSGGVRAEYTQSLGELLSTNPQPDDRVERKYLNLFPSAGVSYNLSEKHSFGLKYNRRIDRPNYQDLNPFEYKLDELTYGKGNPFLRPMYTQNVELSHTFMYMATTSLSYSHTKDFFAEIVDTIDVNRNFQMTRNLANQDVVGLNISSPVPIKDWWMAYVNLGVTHTRNRADYGGGKIINLAVTSANVFMQNTFTLSEKYSLEFSGFYNSPGVWGGTFRNKAMWGTFAGAKAKLFKNKADLSLNFSDVFHSMKWRGISTFGGLVTDARGGWESQQLSVTFTWRFGNQNIKAAREHETGMESESKRIKAGKQP